MSKKLYTKAEWESFMDKADVTKEDLNDLVMNYLVTEGYADAVLEFEKESQTKPSSSSANIEDRLFIRSAIQNGTVNEAVERINSLNPEILDSTPELFFHLQQQKLIELVRQGHIEEALGFSEEELAPLAEKNPKFLEELEQTMALFAFEDKAKSPVGALLSATQRQKVANEANQAILRSMCQEQEPRLPDLLRMLTYSQQLLDEKAFYPKITDLSKVDLEDPKPVGSHDSST